MSVTDFRPIALTTTIPVSFPFNEDDLADLEITDYEAGEGVERISVGHAGPLFGKYLIGEAPDLVLVAEGLRRLADRLIDAVLDGRQELLEEQRHDCYCGTTLEADEVTCGATRCDRSYVQDLSL